MLRRIAHDHYWGQIRPTPLHPEDAKAVEDGTFSPHAQFMKVMHQTIDYEWYFEQYNLTRCVIIMGEAIRKCLKLEKVEEQPETPLDEEIQFGGDYGEQNQIHGNPG